MKTIAFVTRIHPKRPNMLKKCKESVKMQTSDDYIHILHRDDKTNQGYGKHAANKSLIKIKEIPAKYVMVLDDDDMLIDSHFVEDFKRVIKGNPEMVFFKGIVHRFGILPEDQFWKRPPIFGRIGSFCFAIRTDIWIKYIGAFGKRMSGGDFVFLNTCYQNTNKHVWWDRIVAKTQKLDGPGSAKGEHDHA